MNCGAASLLVRENRNDDLPKDDDAMSDAEHVHSVWRLPA